METLKQQFLSLMPAERRRAHFALCERVLDTWHCFVSKKKRIRYVDSVVGCKHVVDLALPGDAFKAAQEGRDTVEVARRYNEPIVAMQDGDLEFPENIEFAYYCIYNLFRKYALGEDIEDWIIVNQAIASEPDQTKWPAMFTEAIA